jgi:ribonuclease HI
MLRAACEPLVLGQNALADPRALNGDRVGLAPVKRQFPYTTTPIDVATAALLINLPHLDPHEEGVEAAERNRRLRVRSLLTAGHLTFCCGDESSDAMRRAGKEAKRVARRLVRERAAGAKRQWLSASRVPCSGRPPGRTVRRWAQREDVTLRFTDGTPSLDGVAAWAWWESPTAWQAGCCENHDNGARSSNASILAELDAAVQAIESYEGTKPLVIVCDNETVARSIWGRSVTADSAALHELARARGVRAVLIRGHHDRRGHARADRRARRAAKARTLLGSRHPTTEQGANLVS